jgi:hypothetical protein
MNEVQARNRNGHGPQNIALLRPLALNWAKLEASKGSMKGRLKRADEPCCMPENPGGALMAGSYDPRQMPKSHSGWCSAGSNLA